MSWAVGYDDRWIGYGVPAICDQPDCSTKIDRGMAYRCICCGLFFCTWHLDGLNLEDQPAIHPGSGVCDRCTAGLPPYEPTPDSIEWISHQLHDPSWAAWRAEQRTSTLIELTERLAAKS